MAAPQFSPTPVVDAEHLYVSFGTYGTAALKRDSGEIVWQRRDLQCNHFRGPGSSPILFRNLLIFHMDGHDKQFVVALDKKTGETIWKVDQPRLSVEIFYQHLRLDKL